MSLSRSPDLLSIRCTQSFRSLDQLPPSQGAGRSDCAVADLSPGDLLSEWYLLSASHSPTVAEQSLQDPWQFYLHYFEHLRRSQCETDSLLPSSSWQVQPHEWQKFETCLPFRRWPRPYVSYDPAILLCKRIAILQFDLKRLISHRWH